MKLIVATDRANAIGWSDGRLAYTGLKKDMARFKALTTGGVVVMGFNTFASLKRPNGLPNRHNIVLTRKNPMEARGLFGDEVDVISNLDYVERLGAQKAPELDIWIIGGASVYNEALDRKIVDEMHITLVHSTSEADVTIKHDLAAWKRFILTQARDGIQWRADPLSREWDGDVQTSYLILKRT